MKRLYRRQDTEWPLDKRNLLPQEETQSSVANGKLMNTQANEPGMAQKGLNIMRDIEQLKHQQNSEHQGQSTDSSMDIFIF